VAKTLFSILSLYPLDFADLPVKTTVALASLKVAGIPLIVAFM
jgi:hypothetical protein